MELTGIFVLVMQMNKPISETFIIVLNMTQTWQLMGPITVSCLFY